MSTASPSNSPEIRILPPELASRIAAGEVVERPSSVIKELMENALDAGASSIEVELAEGGIGLLRVRDDGHGMTSHNLKMAVARHGTSKLGDAGDLEAIASYGFRGEALPSIASVSRFRLISRTRDSKEGCCLSMEGGDDPVLRPEACPPGTAVEVRDLFFNVPARRKFLKTRVTEVRHIHELMVNFALVHPSLRLKLTVDGREKLSFLPASRLEERLVPIYGRDLAEKLIPITGQGGRVKVDGVISLPSATRRTASTTVFVNSRLVRDRQLLGAIAGATSNTLESGRHPIAVIFLQVPPEEVDVNVHPQKLEVRFRDPSAVRGAVFNAISQGLRAGLWIMGDKPTPSAGEKPEQGNRMGAPRARPAPSFLPVGQSSLALDGAYRLPWQDGVGPVRIGPDAPPPGEDKPTSPPLGPAPDAQGQRSAPVSGPLLFIGQLHQTYLLFQTAGGLLLVDQHAAHERITYERIRRQWIEQGRLPGQHLLMPRQMDLGAHHRRIADESGKLLESLGLGLSSFGGSSLLVTTVPAALGSGNVEQMTLDILDALDSLELSSGQSSSALGGVMEEQLAPIWARMACHGSIRAGERLDGQRAQKLMDELGVTENFSTCPHGRPTCLPISLAELERRFGRT